MCVLLVLFLGISLPVELWAQTSSKQLPYEAVLRKAEAKWLEMARIQAEMDVTEREVIYYNKELRHKRREYDKMNDKAQRLKYKVARELSRIDTTVEHRPTYVEWQLSKAERARDRAALFISNTEQARQQKIALLGEQTKELAEAKANFYKQGSPYGARDDHSKRLKKTARKHKVQKDIK
jgi:hypothetical protein